MGPVPVSAALGKHYLGALFHRFLNKASNTENVFLRLIFLVNLNLASGITVDTRVQLNLRSCHTLLAQQSLRSAFPQPHPQQPAAHRSKHAGPYLTLHNTAQHTPKLFQVHFRNHSTPQMID